MIVAAGLMALSGMATAFPQGGFSNGTIAGNSTSAANSTTSAGLPGTTGTTSSDPVTESLFCPKLSGSVIESKSGSAEYLLQCATNYFGIIIDVSFNSTAYVNKRQAAVAPANIQV